VFLGDNNFVDKYQPLQNERFGDLKEIPLKQSVDFATISTCCVEAQDNSPAVPCAAYKGGSTLAVTDVLTRNHPAIE
jgi:hypothetical protein